VEKKKSQTTRLDPPGPSPRRWLRSKVAMASTGTGVRGDQNSQTFVVLGRLFSVWRR
jgi:hypothetical protein